MPAPFQKKQYYLALGDSYTIGEMLNPEESFPNQVYQMIKEQDAGFQAPRIIARTGWTCKELESGIQEADRAAPLRSSYDFVSLLIGVNDQYRGIAVEQYKTSFEELLKKAIRFTAGNPERVVVLSIPDWGVTPFAAGRDRKQVAGEIDAYNAANKEISQRYNIYYIDITPWTREAAHNPSLLAGDGLHPSAKEYRRWAAGIAAFFRSKI